MDIKQYIDYFDDISDLAREQQFTLLEQALESINARFSFPIFMVIRYLVRIGFIAVLSGGTYLLFGYSIWLLLVSILLALLGARLLITEITDSLIAKALKNIVSKN
ncbi:hypothetical protein AHAT_03970 [Agarivorans sp. Toyoura001]|uniref:hypothetical protein n=1 Tax=Agarivorans sp. Toyoura001 TaxID=2283141 RepID=UPI0010E7F888|nr:hypothetical protein [Agarivorans sp. Toyoura001]GDY24507.1 hypothetical protein AHAT_03970 [Agarivorans sp. Toyoura001]